MEAGSSLGAKEGESSFLEAQRSNLKPVEMDGLACEDIGGRNFGKMEQHGQSSRQEQEGVLKSWQGMRRAGSVGG